MDTRLQTVIASLSITEGVWHEKASNMSVLEVSSTLPTTHGRGSVHVLVETIGGFPDPNGVQQQIVHIVQEQSQTPGSITAGITQAIKKANAFLFEENLNAAREDRGIAGVTCVVLKDQDAFVGQCGPSVLYHVGKGHTTRLPPESTWLTSETLQEIDVGKQPPLGLRKNMEPELSHLHVREGDLLILASTSLGKLVTEDDMASEVLQLDAQGVRDRLESLAPGTDLTAIIIELRALKEPASAEEKAIGVPASAGALASLFARASAAVRGWRQSRAGRAYEGEDQDEAESAYASDEDEGILTTRPSIDLSGAAASVANALSTVGRGLATLLVRILPESEATQEGKRPRSVTARKARGAQKPGRDRAEHYDRRWLWAALLIPVVVAMTYVLTRVQYERAREAEFRHLVTSFEETSAAGEASTVADEQRVKLVEAQALLEQALAIKPEDQELLGKLAVIQSQLDRVNRVHRLTGIESLQELADIDGAKARPEKVLVQGTDVYVLDLGVHRIYNYLLNEARDGLQDLAGDRILLREGDEQGAIVLGEFLDMAWVDAGGLLGTNSLLALDRQGHVLQYDPGFQVRELPAVGIDLWEEPVAATGYYGRLYVLDPKANQLLRYTLTNGGFEGMPSNYFSPENVADLANATDIAIDGNVYILHSDGVIAKYQEGASVPFTQRDLDRPLDGPTSLYVTGFMDEDGYVYIADAGNQRIVQFSKTGEFIRQLLGTDAMHMNDLRSLYVDEATEELFFINASGLYLARLPS